MIGGLTHLLQIDYLIEFAVLANIKNYTIAAEQLYTTEASLSRHIKKLEDELKKPLFKRDTRHVDLTNFGQSILPYAMRFADLEKEMNHAIQLLSRTVLTIGVYDTLTDYIQIDALFSAFIKEHPSITVNAVTAHASTYDLLERETCDVIFAPILSGMENPAYEHYCIFHDTAVIILPQKHPLAQVSTFSLDLLKGEKLITLSIDSPLYTLCIQACEQAGFHPAIVMTLSNGNAVINMVENGLGVGFLLHQPSENIHPDYPYFRNTYFASPEPPINVNLYMITKRHCVPAVNIFTKFIHHQLETAADQWLIHSKTDSN
jgi:DNA-binding transcriptional LysR family regulator